MTQEQLDQAVADIERRDVNLMSSWWEHDCCPECGVVVSSTARNLHINWHRENWTTVRYLLGQTVSKP